MLSDNHRKAQIAVDPVNRDPDQFYPTQPEQLLALLEVEQLAQNVWEPACGDGAISKILEEKGHRVFSSDLIDRGYGLAPVDFLLCQEYPMYFKGQTFDIVTNPPYGDLVEPFMKKALSLATGKICFLLRIQCLAGQKRGAIYEQYPPARVWVFSNRTQMFRNGVVLEGSGMFDFVWMVWERGHQGKPEIGWLNTKDVLSSQQSLDLDVTGPSKSFQTRPAAKGEENMATKESFFQKVVDYATATGQAVEEAFDVIIADIEAKKAAIDSTQGEDADAKQEAEALAAAALVDASENEEKTEEPATSEVVTETAPVEEQAPAVAETTDPAEETAPAEEAAPAEATTTEAAPEAEEVKTEAAQA